MKRILIIKLGYSETLDSMLSLTTSLGDVLRTTVILHFSIMTKSSGLLILRQSRFLPGTNSSIPSGHIALLCLIPCAGAL